MSTSWQCSSSRVVPSVQQRQCRWERPDIVLHDGQIGEDDWSALRAIGSGASGPATRRPVVGLGEQRLDDVECRFAGVEDA